MGSTGLEGWISTRAQLGVEKGHLSDAGTTKPLSAGHREGLDIAVGQSVLGVVTELAEKGGPSLAGGGEEGAGGELAVANGEAGRGG